MNRRAFLRTLGAAVVGAIAAKELVLGGAYRADVWPNTSLPLDEARLKSAIEQLFGGRVRTGPAKAYAEYPLGAWEEAGESYAGPVQRVIFRTFALGYYVPYSAEAEHRLHRALFRSMYQTWVQIAERPENRNATLIWRVAPEKRRARDFEDSPDPELLKSERVVLRLRAGLLQRGWRERFEVSPWLETAKPEGAPTRII